MSHPEIKIESDDLHSAIIMLNEITARAREMGLGLVKYPVADVERVCAVLTAGKPKLVREGK